MSYHPFPFPFLRHFSCVAIIALLLANTDTAHAQQDEPVLLASITPVSWLVQALAPAQARVETLLPPGQSPHDYQLRPGDMSRLRQSALLVWVGPTLEPWLAHATAKLSPQQHLALLPEALADALHDEHDHAAHETGHVDPHLWLDPLAMNAQATTVAARLQAIYPQQAAEVAGKLARFQQQMVALDAELAALFAPVRTQGFIVYHDGYQPLVQRYQLKQRAAVWRHESIPAGARERTALLQLLHSGEVSCLFYEPEYGRTAIQGWLGSAAGEVQLVELDVLGQQTPAGPDAYTQFMRTLAARMTSCLAAHVNGAQAR